MVPTLPEDSIIVSLPFGGAVLRSLGCTGDEVNALLEDTRKKFIVEKGEFWAQRANRCQKYPKFVAPQVCICMVFCIESSKKCLFN